MEVAVMLRKREGESSSMFIVRWAARVLSLALSFLLILFFLGEGLGLKDLSPVEFVGLFFFPLGLIAGFIVGWRNEMLGGIISVLSTVAFYLVYGILVTGTIPDGFAFAVFTIPGMLFLVYGLIDRIVLHHPGVHHISV